jgi:transcriptional regulator with XRE-family HTH domain
MPKRMQDLPAEYFVNQRARAEAIGARVRVRREQLGLKQEQLRARLELEGVYISRANFSRLENGDTVPDALELDGLVSVLDVSFDWLVRGE